MRVKVLSWNTWVDGHFDSFKELISRENAEIVGLQEVREVDKTRDVVGFMTDLGYKNVFAPKQVWRAPYFLFGPALFSKFDIAWSATHTLSREDERYAVQGDLAVDKDTVLHVFSTHLTHTHQKPSKIQDQQIDGLLKILPKERTILMGDFNATPDSAAILLMSKVLQNTDPSNAPTWSTDPRGCPTCNPQSVDTRLDYIFASKDLKASEPRVVQSTASDHLPITAVIDL